MSFYFNPTMVVLLLFVVVVKVMMKEVAAAMMMLMILTIIVVPVVVVMLTWMIKVMVVEAVAVVVVVVVALIIRFITGQFNTVTSYHNSESLLSLNNTFVVLGLLLGCTVPPGANRGVNINLYFQFSRNRICEHAPHKCQDIFKTTGQIHSKFGTVIV